MEQTPKRVKVLPTSKACTVCKETKDLPEFYKDPSGWLGVRSRCKKCEQKPDRKCTHCN